MQIDQNKIAELQASITDAETIAKQIVDDSHQGGSQFAAPIRAALGHALDLIHEHARWVEANPAPTPKG